MESKISYLDALKKNLDKSLNKENSITYKEEIIPKKPKSQYPIIQNDFTFEINISENLHRQLNIIYDEAQNKGRIKIVLNKMTSFCKIYKSINTKFSKNKIIELECIQYDNTENILEMKNNHTYNIVFNGSIIFAYIDGIKIDTTQSNLVINSTRINHEFILDLFILFDKINKYEWDDEDDETMMVESGVSKSNAMYGSASGIYERVRKNIIRIETYSCHYTYSGMESYYDIISNKTIHESCGCFRDKSGVDHILNKYTN
jgi:hypothetical protein